MNNSVKKMWKSYLKTINELPETTDKTYESWHYMSDDDEDRDIADNLAELTKNGIKKATSSDYEFYDNLSLPKEGSYSIVTNFDGTAVCIIKNTHIEIVPFCDVTPLHAKNEGEGDFSLEYWKTVHKNFFSLIHKADNKVFNDNMLVVCETFTLVYK